MDRAQPPLSGCQRHGAQRQHGNRYDDDPRDFSVCIHFALSFSGYALIVNSL